MCTKNCCKVGDIIFVDWHDSDCQICDVIKRNGDILEKYDAFNEMFDNYGGHDNYALAWYCVKNNHLNCLKYISNIPGFMHHADLAICAAEFDNLECLQYILEEIGDVHVPELKDAGANCKFYMLNFYKKYPNTTYVDKVYKEEI